MASNFTIRFHRRNRNVHINLRGDFDGSSACVLFNALKKNCDNEDKIFVDTSGLRQVSPFGRGVLQNNLSGQERKWANITFTGGKARQIAPENSLCV